MTSEMPMGLQPTRRSRSGPPSAPTAQSQSPTGILTGLRVLIVEDEFLVGLILEDDLKAKGSEIVATCQTLVDGTRAAENSEFDLAILDINLNGEMVFPLADVLVSRSKPLIFLSGYIANLPERFAKFEAVSKPYQILELESAIARALAANRSH
jgi:two-component SAPR family response regulator